MEFRRVVDKSMFFSSTALLLGSLVTRWIYEGYLRCLGRLAFRTSDDPQGRAGDERGTGGVSVQVVVTSIAKVVCGQTCRLRALL